MIAVDEMLKAIVLSGRDEGYMDDGDAVSATNQIMVYFNGFDKTYDDKDEEIDDKEKEKWEHGRERKSERPMERKETKTSTKEEKKTPPAHLP